MLALAIGLNTAMFSFIDGVFLSPLPYGDSDRIVSVLERRPDGAQSDPHRSDGGAAFSVGAG